MAALSKDLPEQRLMRSYQNYVDRFIEKEALMERHGTKMYDDRPMTFDEYCAARDALIESGQEININQTLVSRQQYEFTREQGRALREAGRELGLEIGDEKIINLRGGGVVRNEDLSLINNKLKELYPNMTGIERAKWITDNIFFGSE